MANPLVPTVHSADPAARVWPGDDRLWIYDSHDHPGTNTRDTMDGYHVFSSRDLVGWTDHGRVLHLSQVSWAVSHLWAVDAVYWRGKYVLIFCAIERATGQWRTGLAESERPEGPFTDTGFVRGVEWGQDPALFIDDDGAPYLFWGAGGCCRACRLADDLRSALPGTGVDLTAQLTWVYEGPWVHKYEGRYYLSYPGLTGGRWPEEMYYATADHPLGPYSFRGCYLPHFKGGSGTNHGSITRYRDRWYAFHHSSRISGLSECRSLMADELHHEPDGSIRSITPDPAGVAAPGSAPGPARVTVRLAAASAVGLGGALHGTHVAHDLPGAEGPGHVTGFDRQQFGVSFLVQVATPLVARLRLRYAAPLGPRRLKVLINSTLLDDPRSPDPTRYDKAHDLPASSAWTELDAGPVPLRAGDNTLRLYLGPNDTPGGIALDLVLLDLTPEPA